MNSLTLYSQLEVRGKIVRTFLSQENLRIEGVLNSNNQVYINAFKVNFNGIDFYIEYKDFLEESKPHFFDLNINLNESFFKKLPKKQQIYSSKFSNLRQGFACLFPNIFARCYNRAIRNQNALVKVTLLFSSEKDISCSFYGLVNILLPLPTERENRKIGGGSLVEISSEFLSLMIEQAGLKQTDDVLDIGCGCGRMAYALAYYLKPSACYEGFDIMSSLIRRAQKFITPYFPNFQFRHVDIWNGFYNPQGKKKSSSFYFPYSNKSFDFVLLTSVFSHMLTVDICHYLAEIYRVLRFGGCCLFSCFLLTDESKKLIKENRSTQELIYPFEDYCYVVSPKYPEASIGYELYALLDLVKKAGFEIQKVYFGSWCGREKYISYQDIVIVYKAG